MFVEIEEYYLIDKNEVFGVKYNKLDGQENGYITISYKSISRDDETLYNKTIDDFYEIKSILKGE